MRGFTGVYTWFLRSDHGSEGRAEARGTTFVTRALRESLIHRCAGSSNGQARVLPAAPGRCPRVHEVVGPVIAFCNEVKSSDLKWRPWRHLAQQV